jgi:hypothetical protein
MGLPSRKEEIDLRRRRKFRSKLRKILVFLAVSILIIGCSVFLIQHFFFGSSKIIFSFGDTAAGIFKADVISYRDRIPASTGTKDDLFLVFFSQSPKDIFLLVNWTATSPKVSVDIKATYVEILCQNGHYNIVNTTTTFDVKGRCSLFPTLDIKGYLPLFQEKMIWKYPDPGVTGCGALMLSFSYSTGGLKSGEYNLDLRFKLVEL